MTAFHVFAGYPSAPGAATVVHLTVGYTSYDCAPLAHHVRHSPDGFAWGYAGSGPTELARCLLIASLGAAALCRTCDGTLAAAAGQPCDACDAGFDRPRVEDRYYRVRDRLVARLPRNLPLALTSADVISAADLAHVTYATVDPPAET